MIKSRKGAGFLCKPFCVLGVGWDGVGSRNPDKGKGGMLRKVKR